MIIPLCQPCNVCWAKYLLKNKYTLDGDILALERLIQTILFYDDVFFINDYKSEYIKSRGNFFQYIYPVDLDNETYNSVIAEAQRLTNDFIPKIEKKSLENESLKDFFQLLKMNIVFTWDLSSSVYYLTFKLLQNQSGVDISKYSKLSSMIFSQLFSNEPVELMNEKKPIIYDSKGVIIDENYMVKDKYGSTIETGGFAKQTEKFIAGLNWMDFRTTFYILVAKHCKFDVVLHPIRNAYEVNVINKYSSCREEYSNIIIDAMNDRANKAINCILSPTQPLIMKYKLPMFSAWIASKCSDLKDIINVAYTIKGEKEFSQARDILKNLDAIHAEKGNQKYVTEANLLITDFEKQLLKLMDKYGVAPSELNLTSSLISVYNLSSIATNLPQIADFGFTVKNQRG